MKVKIDKCGNISFLYSDDYFKFANAGKVTIKRASNVEPTKDNKWIVDLKPLKINKKLGPFKTRKEALDKERIYIEKHYL